VDAATSLGDDKWVVKCQVHAGGRGKAGGVKVARSKDDVRAFVEQWLGKNLVTYQTDAKGQPVNCILVEACTGIAKELYLGAVVDRSSRRVVFMASTEGGMEIEKVAHDTPELIHKAVLDPLAGPQPYQARELGFKLGLNAAQLKQFTAIFMGLGKMFVACDLSLLEINPLVITDKAICFVWMARSISTPMLSIASPSSEPCTMSPKRMRVKLMRPSGNSTMWHWMAVSVVW